MIVPNETGKLRAYELSSNAQLRDNRPPDKRISFSEEADHARIRTGNLMFDGLYALAVSEALQNSVSQIKDGAYGHGQPIQLEAFQTGEFWTYVWTRDLSYSTYLALAGFDPQRAIHSLLFKTSLLKPSVSGGFTNQVVQDTGSGGSYPVSSDRIVWILGASEVLKYLPEPEQKSFLEKVWPILHDTLEQDRRVVFDPEDGLYRGEQSFLDWREQSYPGWTKNNVMGIAMSKALSVNAANYFALRTASRYAERLGRHDDQIRYAAWAKELRNAISRRFFDPVTGLYSTYILTDSAYGIRAQRYDLLGESLAVLLGVADDAQTKSIISHYPTGPHGPPVVWPQEHTVPIYHNQGIWPFVTAFWTKAARKVNNAAVVDQGIHSLMRGAALNLSNMENFDFVTGKARVKDGILSGPVITSRRQIWSVAGYLSMVQDVVFGLETSWDGIRFLPYVTGHLRNETFGSTNLIELQNFKYRGKTIDVRVHLPPTGAQGPGSCGIAKIELNGKTINKDFVAATGLRDQNEWDVYLQSPAPDASGGKLDLIENVSDGRTIFGPVQPEWETIGEGGITVEKGLLTLHYRQADASNVVFNIYRDGQLCAKHVSKTQWVDPDSSDYANKTHFYAVEALDEKSGNVSHLTPTRFYAGTNAAWIIPTKEMENRGGKLADNRYFMDWGKPDHELRVKSFTAKRSGHYLVRVEFSNGAGPVNTGITCAVKKLEIRETDSGKIVGAGYLVMPQSGNWQRFDLSSPVRADLKAGKSYSIRIFEDEYSRNMSYLAHNERYTAFVGGGNSPYNFVNIASIRLLHFAD
ncbi:MAG TPA: amylo-alpha-1,6-glucosidase [Verrucomicrobiae bacterium]|nr:amylo-alpha-1,6-glucosidase [Verrucomicrobiae bacterium]